MRLSTVRIQGREEACLRTSAGLLTMESINRHLNQKWPGDLFDLIRAENLTAFQNWYDTGGREKLDGMRDRVVTVDPINFAPLYRHPPKIWGIGLNYAAHAADLSEKVPSDLPASFMKPDTAIIGNGDAINIPVQSHRTTAEAELGIVIGKKCKNVKRNDWLSVVAGFTCIIDMTAEDILRQNPRYLTLSKSFNTFFSFGPQLVTPDEIEFVFDLEVATVINGKIHARNAVSNMTFPPDFLVSFHSDVMTLLPGDIISTGTPGAVHIQDGDNVECRIAGFEPLINPVRDLKAPSS